MNCPKCKSDKIMIIELSYPKSFECKECGSVFVKVSKSLVDE